MHTRRSLPLGLSCSLLACGDGSSGGASGSVTSIGSLVTGGAETEGSTGGGGGTTVTGGGPVEDDAEIVAVGLPTALACGEVFAATVEVRNTGTATWTRDGGYKLAAVDDGDPFYHADTRVWLPEGVTIAPGETYVFAFEVQATPSAGSHVTDWQMVHEGVQWFGEIAAAVTEVACAPVDPGVGGLVRLEGRAMADDDGPFNALGATMMWAAWGYKFDRPRLAQNLAFLRDHGFDYIRALGVVGDYDEADYWDGREIDWRWPDYAEVIAGLTDLAYDVYGLRVEWTLIGDGQKNIPDPADREALVATFVEMAAARPGKVIHFELANESWQNGFEGDAGVQQLRALTAMMRGATDLVAASAPAGVLCEDVQAIYAGDVADLATIHFDRDSTKVEGSWRPVRQPWEHQFCEGVPVATNNEPIGPGSSVAEESDPVRLVAGAITTYVSGLPAHVFHSSAGVRGDQNVWEMPGADAFVHLRTLLPPGLAAWDQQNAHWPTAPFIVYAGQGGQLFPDTMWVDLDAPESGAVRAYGATRNKDFVVFPIGILGEVVIEPRRPAHFDVIDPMTGATLATHDLSPGQTVAVSGGEALLLRGRFLD